MPLTPGNGVASGGSQVNGFAEDVPSSIKRSAARGAAFILARQVFVQAANVLGVIFLSRELSTAQFGVYAILTFLSQTMMLLSGSALALQIIRSPTPLGDQSIKVLFTAQFSLAILSAAAWYVGSPSLSTAFGLESQNVWIVQLVSVGFLLSCFQSIPTAMLERSLRFDRLAISEISQSVVFNLCAVGGAWAGMGVVGVAAGIAARVVVGTIIVSCFQRWPIGFAMDLRVLREEIGSGVTYFGSSIISLLKDAINPIFLGLALGAAEVGLVNWAIMLSSYCLLALMLLQRLYIPAFARMAAFPEHLPHFVTNILRITNAIVAPVACLVLALIYPITVNIFGAKWLPALPLFLIFWLANVIVPTVHPLLSLLQVLKGGRVVLFATFSWMVLTWLVGIPAILTFGIFGAAIANFIVQCTSVYVCRVAKRAVRIQFFKPIFPFWIIAAGCAIVVGIIEWFFPAGSAIITVIYFIVGGGLYCGAIFLFFRDELKNAVAALKKD